MGRMVKEKSREDKKDEEGMRGEEGREKRKGRDRKRGGGERKVESDRRESESILGIPAARRKRIEEGGEDDGSHLDSEGRTPGEEGRSLSEGVGQKRQRVAKKPEMDRTERRGEVRGDDAFPRAGSSRKRG